MRGSRVQCEETEKEKRGEADHTTYCNSPVPSGVARDRAAGTKSNLYFVGRSVSSEWMTAAWHYADLSVSVLSHFEYTGAGGTLQPSSAALHPGLCIVAIPTGSTDQG